MRSFRLPIIFAIILLCFLPACVSEQHPPLRLASSPWPGYEPLYLARDLNYLDESSVRVFELPSSDITMESFRNRSADLATLTLDEVVELIHDGTHLKILLVLDVSHGGDAVMVKPGIRTAEDIRGARISTTNIPLGMYMLSRFLDSVAVSREEVQVFPMADTNQLQFYREGKADVVITYDPVKTHLLGEGMRVMFDSSDIPNEIFDLLVVHEDVYEKRRDELCDIGRQWFRALRYMEESKEDAAQRISKRMGVDRADYESVMSGLRLPSIEQNRTMVEGEDSLILATSKKLSKIMLENQQIKKMVDARGAIAADFIGCVN